MVADPISLPSVCCGLLSLFPVSNHQCVNFAVSCDRFWARCGRDGVACFSYFLVFAGAQIPIGVLLDRHGPRRVQSVLLVIAVGGISLFGNADSLAELLVGRAMIGLGVAAALMAGLKA